MGIAHAPEGAEVRGEGDAGRNAVAWDLVAQHMLHEKRWDDAAKLINARLRVNDKDTEAQFMSDLVEVGRGNYGQAIRLFRRILSDHPSATRVRLELGRAFFLKRLPKCVASIPLRIGRKVAARSGA